MQITSKIVGVLNLSPNSFFNGNTYSKKELIDKISDLIRSGVDVIDAGSESTAPLTLPISLSEELRRLEIFFDVIGNFPQTVFSLDTMKSEVAEIGIQKGIKVINDVSGGRFDENMFKLIAKHKDIKYVLMYCKNSSGLADLKVCVDSVPILDKVTNFFDINLEKAKKSGINKSQIILDPGMGVFLSADYNDSVEILKNLNILKTRYNQELLIGTSRKGFLSNLTFDNGPEDRLGSSLASAIFACQNGADYIRIHDVRETKQFIECFNNLSK